METIDQLTPKYYKLKNFKFQNGETLKNLKVEYIAIGTPKKDENGYITNGIVYFHGWGGDYGSLRRISKIIGRGNIFDTNKFFLICISALGSPNSASPSTTELANDFPKYSIEDMIRFQMKFLKEKFNIIHLCGVIGNSMGGFEVLELAAKYPNYMDFVISLVSSYKIAGHNYAIFKFMNHIIENDPNYEDGKYSKPVKISSALANESMYPFGLSREFYRNELTNNEIDVAMNEMAEEGSYLDANDIIWRNNASTNYDIEDIISNIKAKTMIVAINQDQYFPPDLDAIPMSKMIKNSQLVIYNSLLGHVGTNELIKIEKELNEFLKEFK